MTWIEAIAALLIVVNVALVARRSVWNYPFAIAGVTLFAFVFKEARLYSDMGLQGFFLVLNVYGWATWTRAKARAGEVLVETLSPGDRWFWACGCTAATIAWGAVMHAHTDAASPWADAGIAVTSVAAQYLLACRKLENWVMWIGVDLVAIPLFASRGLWATAAVYLVLLVLAIWGYRGWRRALRNAGREAALVPA